MAAAIDEPWQRLERWAAANAPCVLEDLNPGAIVEQIKALERQLGRALPPDLRQSLRLHNGEGGMAVHDLRGFRRLPLRRRGSGTAPDGPAAGRALAQ